MTTPRVHYVGSAHVLTAACGRYAANTGGISRTADRDAVTCRACLARMGQ